MWLSLLAPFGKASRFSSILCKGKCSLRRQSSGKGLAKSTAIPWTLEEDRKLDELYRKGLKLKQIVDEMDNRTYGSCGKRLMAIKGGAHRPTQGKRISRAWTAEENALLLEKQQQGLKLIQIATYFPGRSMGSVCRHLSDLSRWSTTAKPIRLREFSDAQIQRVIDMRLNEAKTIAEIAAEFKTSIPSISGLWHKRIVFRLSKDMQDTLKSRRVWMPNETKHLLELHRQGTLCLRDVALQFPSKTTTSVAVKCAHDGLRFPRHSKKPDVSIPIKSDGTLSSDASDAVPQPSIPSEV